MSKHILGKPKWKVVQSKSCTWGKIEVAPHRYITVEGRSRKEAEAIIVLIEAAPKLLEALRRIATGEFLRDAEYIAKFALEALGELDDDNRQEDQGHADGDRTSHESTDSDHARRHSGHESTGVSPASIETDGGATGEPESVCEYDGCEDPVGDRDRFCNYHHATEHRYCAFPGCLLYLIDGDGDMCIEHDTMRNDSQEADDGK